MSRIRTVKPGLWTNEQFVQMSMRARLTYIGMWNFCDDAGIMPASVKTVKMQVLPGDDVTSVEVAEMVAEMQEAGLLFEYEAQGKRYWKITSWEADQKVDRPSYLYPKPPFVERSSNDQRALDDGHPPEGKGRERKGEERKGGEGDAPAQEALPNSSSSPTLESLTAQCEDWAAANAEEVKGWIAKMRYDVERFGKAFYQIPRFVDHYFDEVKRPGEAAQICEDPVRFFKNRFPGWLAKAKEFDKPYSSNPANAAKGSQGPQQPKPMDTKPRTLGKAFAQQWTKTNMPGVGLTASDLHFFACCESEQEMWMLARKFPVVMPEGVQIVQPADSARQAKVVSLQSALPNVIALAQ